MASLLSIEPALLTTEFRLFVNSLSLSIVEPRLLLIVPGVVGAGPGSPFTRLPITLIVPGVIPSVSPL